MAKTRTLALLGSETLMGREIRELMTSHAGPLELKLIAAEEQEEGRLTEQSGEPALVWGLNAEALGEADGLLLAGGTSTTNTALEIVRSMPDPPFLVDVTHATEEHPRARLRAPMLEPAGYTVPGDAIHVVAHPAAIAMGLLLRRLHPRHTVRRAVVHVFEPASERGSAALEELERQTVNLLSFKGLPTRVFGAQLGFNLLARYGEDAPVSLESVERRVERHLASLLALAGSTAPPMPSLRVIQAPVFHGHAFSVWVEFERNPGVDVLEAALAGPDVDVRGQDLDPPTAVGMAGQSGIAVGAIAADPNAPQACWIWMAADNLRLAAENALAVADGLA